MKESAISKKTWEEIEKELYTPKEIEESNHRVALLSKEIKEKQGSVEEASDNLSK